MLEPFNDPPFSPWTQTNPLLTRPKKDSHLHHVIMDLSWPLPPGVSVNSCTPKESFFGIHKQMHLPSANDFCNLIREAGRGCFLFATDVARVCRQLPLNPRDWPLVCLTFEGHFCGHQSALRLEMGSISLPRCHQPGVQGIEESGTFPPQLH